MEEWIVELKSTLPSDSDEAAAAYAAMSDDELRGHLATAMASQDFEMCVYLRDMLQSRAGSSQQQ